MEAIRKLVSEMKHTVKKTDILEQHNKNINSLNNEVMPVIESLSKFISENNLDIKDIKELSNFNRVSELKSKDIKSMFKEISNILDSMSKNGSVLGGSLDKELPDYVSKDIITIKEAYLLVLVNNYTSVVTFTMDFMLYVVDILGDTLTGRVRTIIKSKLFEVRGELVTYANILKFFNDNRKLDKVIKKLSNDNVVIDNKDASVLSSIISSSKTLPVSNFIGNPIYHVKMWLIDMQLNRYEVLKEKKKITELKILELEARLKDDNDPKVVKAIEYHEDKLEAIEYKIRKIEE